MRCSWVMASDYEFLREHNVQYIIPWIMPVGINVGSARMNITRSLASGLTFRPLATTTMDVLEWWHSDAVADERRETAWSGRRDLTPEREAEIVAAWKARGR